MNANVTSLHTDGRAGELSPVVDGLKSALGAKLIALVLFGSRARGDAHPESDWDILLVAKELPRSAYQRNAFLLSCLPAMWRCRVSFVAKTPEEFEATLPPLYLDAAMDGIILYDTGSYMHRKLAHVRRKIDEMGLFREKRGKDFLWLWRTPPRGPWKFEWAS